MIAVCDPGSNFSIPQLFFEAQRHTAIRASHPSARYCAPAMEVF